MKKPVISGVHSITYSIQTLKITLKVSHTGKSLSEALLFAKHGENMFCKKNGSECQKQFLYTTCSPQLGIFMY